MRTRKLIFLSLLVAVGLVLGLFESVIPLPVMIPGARLGLANIVVLVALVFFGYKEGFVVTILKSFVLMLVTGAVTSFVFSFAGAVLSCVAMILAHKYLSKYLSLVGISLIGSSFHNFGQVLCACIVLNNFMIFSYLPILLILGIFTGYFVGISSDLIIKNLSKHKELKW